jgi:hypothetical protein
MLKSSSLCLNSSNLGTFWLKIEQFWPFEEISIFSNGGHLGYRTAFVKIYPPCNFEENLITHLGVIALFSSIYFLILILFILYFKNYLEIDVKFKWQKCAACQDLPSIKINKKKMMKKGQ